MRRVTLFIIALPLLLGGCAEWVARLMQDAALAHQLSFEYVMENTGYRQDIRRMCWESLLRQADAMRIDGGDEINFRRMLIVNYPGLVTVSTAKEASEDAGSVLAHPYICGPK